MKKINTTIVLIVAILLFANLVSEQYYFRLDLTEDKQYTLSDATADILKSIDDPVTVKAYFSEDLPPDVAKVQKKLEEYLIEYGRISDDNIVYSFVNPNDDEKIEQEAMQAGVNPILLNVRDKDQMKQQKAFLGAVIEMGDQKEVIPFIQPDAPLEYMLSSAIKKIAVLDKPTIGLIQGHGEPNMSEMQQVAAGLSVLYNFEPFNLNDTTPIPEHFSTLALVRPTDSISDGALRRLDSFLERGGNLFVAINRVKGDLQNSFGSSLTTGLETWLRDKGIDVKNNFIIDAQCGNVTVQQQQGMFVFNTNVQFPYIPIIQNFADHSITKGLEAVVLQFASSMEYVGSDSAVSFTPIAFTSENSGTNPAPLYFNVQKQWGKPDFPLSKQIVAGVLEKQLGNGSLSRMCIVSDGDFAVGSANPQQRVHEGNVHLMVNSIDWLSDDTGLIDLRTKGIAYRPLEELEDSTKTALKYLNFLLPIILVVVYGVVRMQMNAAKRIKRMELDYSDVISGKTAPKVEQNSHSFERKE